MIWQLKSGNNYIDMPTPASYSIESNDLDDESYRNVTNGSVVRQLVSRQWQKITMSFPFRSESDCASMLTQLNANDVVTIKCKSPIMSTNGWVELTGYISQYNVEMVNAGRSKGYTLNFAFVEGYRS